MVQQERRAQERDYPRRLSVRVRLGECVEECRLLNQSDHGAGLFADRLEGLREGTAVEVELEEGRWRSGVVQYVKELPHGGRQWGVQW